MIEKLVKGKKYKLVQELPSFLFNENTKPLFKVGKEVSCKDVISVLSNVDSICAIFEGINQLVFLSKEMFCCFSITNEIKQEEMEI